MSEKTIKGRKGNGHRGKERSKGMGTLEKRGHIYIARWTVEGRRYSQSTGEMRVLFAVGIYTGLWRGDCSMLEWSQIDLVRGFISLIPRKTARKNGRSVTIPIHPVLMNILLEADNVERKGYGMPECAGLYQMRPKVLSDRVKRIFRLAGLETATNGQDGPRKRALVSFHSLRHPFVSMSANARVPLAVVQSIVGCATADMTRHYYHESQGALVAAVTALPDVVKPGTGNSSIDTMTPRVKALCAALDALDAQEREMVLLHLQGVGRAFSVALVPCAPESAQSTVQYPLVPVAAA